MAKDYDRAIQYRLATLKKGERALPPPPKISQRVRRILGQIGCERGSQNEARVFAVFSGDNPALPGWFRSIEKASREQDQRGIDAIVHTTDVGMIYLQIKSSLAGRRKFESQSKRRWPVAVVIVNHYESDEAIRQKVISAAGDLRNVFLSQR
jgi:hypothetical protein